MAYYKSNDLELSNGNLKLGKDTLIFNMGTAQECPSRRRGLCKLGNKCYALKAERLYPTCIPYRKRQAKYWQNTPIGQVCCDFSNIINRMRTKPKYFRFNEAGDFWTQRDVTKLDKLAEYLKRVHNIETYGYTARKDLDFSKVSFNVKGSGHDNGNNGKTIAIPKDKIEEKRVNSHEMVKVIDRHNIAFEICPMDCRDCTLCKTRNHKNIVFPLH